MDVLEFEGSHQKEFFDICIKEHDKYGGGSIMA